MKEKISVLPISLKTVVAILSLEALFLVIWAGVLVVVAIQSGQLSVYASYAFGIFYLIVAASLFFAAHGIIEGKRFARSMAIVWQLFAVIIGIQMYFAGAALGLVATIAGGAVLIFLFARGSLNYFEEKGV